MTNAKKYNNIKLTISVTKGVITFALILLFVALGYSLLLDNFLKEYIGSNYLRLLAFTGITGLAMSLLFLPVNFYSGYLLEHKFGLSNQSIGEWIKENLKGLAVGLAIGIPVMLIFYYVLETFGADWWLPFAIIMFILSVVLAQIVPVLILPVFYKILPLENEDLKERIYKLAGEAGLKVENVYTFDMSKETKKANAAFTGLGKTKRIILGDTLLESYSSDEIETVIAHELGHYKRKHIVKNIILGTIISFLTFFLMAWLYDLSIPWFMKAARTDIAALPLLSLWAMIIGFIQAPVSNIISRAFEYEADRYAVEATGKGDVLIGTLEKLTDQNLGDREPHPLVEWYSYSHPSIKKRRAALEDFINVAKH